MYWARVGNSDGPYFPSTSFTGKAIFGLIVDPGSFPEWPLLLYWWVWTGLTVEMFIMSGANYEYLQKPNTINCLCLQNKMVQKMCISKLVLNGTWTYIYTFPRILCKKHYKTTYNEWRLVLTLKEKARIRLTGNGFSLSHSVIYTFVCWLSAVEDTIRKGSWVRICWSTEK